MGGVFVAGSLHLDVVVEAPHLPARDETVTGQGVSYQFGGKGGNQAVAAARMGARVAMAGRVGDDAFAARLLTELDRAGVDRSRVLTAPGASGMSVAILEPGGDYGAVIVSGANLLIDPATALPPPGARVVLLQNEIPEAVNLAVARAARRQGARVILNAAPARALDPAMLGLTDILVVNRGEAAALAGADMAPPEAAAALRARGAAAVIVTLGGDGIAGRDSDGAAFQAPAHAVSVISTHGAGDAFLGALAAMLAEDAPVVEAAGFAQAAAALHVSRAPEARARITPDAVRAFRAAQPIP